MIGVDIIKIERMEKFIKRYGEKGLKRFLGPSEIVLAKSARSTAGLWAAKEAVSKALGCGIGTELGFLDITLSKNDKGAPLFSLPAHIVARYRIAATSLSISHDGEYAIAVAAIETVDGKKC